MKMFNGKEIELGEKILFFDLWDGNGDQEEILESGCLQVAEENGIPVIAGFEVIEQDEKNPVVKITEFY